MKLRMLPFLAVACLCLSGCPAYSANPLYGDEDAVVEPALEGTWVDDLEEKVEFVFRLSGAHQYSLAISDAESRRTQNYKVNLVRLRDRLFMDLIFTDQTVDGTKVEDPLGGISNHVIAKVDVAGDDLAYAALEDGPIEKQNTGATPLRHLTTDGGLLVTARTETLRRYISDHPDDAFGDFEHLTRKR